MSRDLDSSERNLGSCNGPVWMFEYSQSLKIRKNDTRSKDDLLVVGVVWWDAYEHFVQEDAQEVPIHRLSVTLPPKHLRSQIGWRTAEASRLGVVEDADFRQAKVCEESMAILIEDDVVWLQIPEDDVSPMQVLQRKQHLCQIVAGFRLGKPLVLLESSAHIATRCIVQQQEELFWRLESIFESDYEWMCSVSKHISLSLRILHQVLPQDLLLVEYLHGKELPRLLLLPLRINPQLLHQVHYAERALSQLHDCLEILGPNPCLVFSTLPLQLLVQLPNGYEFVLPSAIRVGNLLFFLDLDFFSTLCLLLLFLCLETLNQLLLIATGGQLWLDVRKLIILTGSCVQGAFRLDRICASSALIT